MTSMDERQMARNLTERLLVCATGAGISFADRAEVEEILDRTREGGYGPRGHASTHRSIGHFSTPMNPTHINRRNFLHATGVCLAQPSLDAFAAAAPEIPRRMVWINASMGLLPKEFFLNGEPRGRHQGHRTLTHQGNRLEVLAQRRRIEEARLRDFRDFLTSLSATPEGGDSRLDRTMVLYGSHLDDANRHSNDNPPVMLAGGGFRHGRPVALDPKHNLTLANLYVSMLQRLGVETDRFASGTGTLRGLEIS